MNTNNAITVTARPRFATEGVNQLTRPLPTSPMVLRLFVQSLAELSRKVDQLATRPPERIVVKEVQIKEVQKPSPAAETNNKVNRKELRSFFD
jgi:hypothetical protein